MATGTYDAKAGEIWQDGEGCLIVNVGEGKWLAFGSEQIIGTENKLVVDPLVLVFDAEGNAHSDKLAYPNGNAFRGGNN